MDSKIYTPVNATDSPSSGLYIIGPKSFTEDDYHKHFDEFGTIEKIYRGRDKNGEPAGITYIKFSKHSEAANALEKMDGALLVFGTRLKILAA